MKQFDLTLHDKAKEIIKNNPQAIKELFNTDEFKLTRRNSKKAFKGVALVLNDYTAISIKSCLGRDKYDFLPLSIARRNDNECWHECIDDYEVDYFVFVVRTEDTVNFYALNKCYLSDLLEDMPTVETYSGGKWNKVLQIPTVHKYVKKCDYEVKL